MGVTEERALRDKLESTQAELRKAKAESAQQRAEAERLERELAKAGGDLESALAELRSAREQHAAQVLDERAEAASARSASTLRCEALDATSVAPVTAFLKTLGRGQMLTLCHDQPQGKYLIWYFDAPAGWVARHRGELKLSVFHSNVFVRNYLDHTVAPALGFARTIPADQLVAIAGSTDGGASRMLVWHWDDEPAKKQPAANRAHGTVQERETLARADAKRRT